MGTSRYSVVRRLGQGGMGVVYEAIDRERSQPIALKTLIDFSPAALYRFKQEFRTLAGVQHRNLVRLYELVVTETDDVFFTMELVQGADFLTYVQKPGAVSVGHVDSRVTGIASTPPSASPVGPAPTTSPSDFDKLRPTLRQLVEGVQALHGAGKLHRDIKPSNVLVAPDGRVVILDFGVATEFSRVADANLSEEHEMVGTARYMAPEQAFDGLPTPASDWYSVGVILYEAVVGRAPFVGSALDVLTMKTLQDAVPPAECVQGVPADLDALCRALLEREPEKRPTGLEILHRLGGTRSVRPLPSLPPAADLTKAATLVGREAQLRALGDAFETVLSGRSVTVRVGGLSGMGKSAVTQYFLDGLVERGQAVVLRGRAYERESVPYKAVDSVIDALSRYLMHLGGQGEAVELPSEIGALARVFPVLRRVPSIGDVAEHVGMDPQLVRRRAFSALRELLGTLAERQPLVLYIDDVQWGDTDSAALLLELTRPPEAPAVLLVMTYRNEDVGTSPFLAEMRARWPSGVESRDVAVGPLDLEDAQRLALALLDASSELAHRTARAVARESRGSPFLIEELVRSNRGIAARSDGPTLAVLTLDELVSQRLERLPDDARLLLELVAVGGRPLPVSVVAQASEVGDAIDDVIALVSDRRFVRGSLRDGRELVETSHDRFRETIVAQLSPDALRERHGRLARALEAAPGVDTEAVAMHWLGAGHTARAVQFAERAAEEATTKLAFSQAARLFRLILDAIGPSSPDARRWRERLGQVLEWAGRSADAARVYVEAAEWAPAPERLNLRRAAAEQLLAAGRIDEGREAIHRVLAEVGMTAPHSPLAAILFLVAYRIWFAMVGLTFRERSPEQVTPAERVRLDALFAAALGLAVVDSVPALALKSRYFIEALRVGDRSHVSRGAVLESTNFSTDGGPIRARERALLDLSQRLADTDRDPAIRAFQQSAQGIGMFLRGGWREAADTLDGAFKNTPLLRAGWQANAFLFAIYSLCFLGELREAERRRARLLAEADERGDLYTAVNLRAGPATVVRLAADDPDSARRDVTEAMTHWSKARFLIQHWQAMLASVDTELYAGDGDRAYERVERDARELKKSLLLRVQFVRGLTYFARGRSAVAADALAAVRAARLTEACALTGKLERERMPWTAPLASLLAASVANARGDRPGATASLRAAIERARLADMPLYGAAARHALGSLLGGDEGQRFVETAVAAMAAQGVQSPGRFTRMLLPGTWKST